MDGNCTVYRGFEGNLSVLKRPPVSVGFEVDLYTNHHAIDDKQKYDIEARVLRRVDNDAADALRHFETNPGDQLPVRLRDGWARFLMSLLHRAPDRVAELKRAVAEKSKEIAGEIRAKFPDLAEKSDDEILSDADNAELHQDLLRLLIDSKNIGQHLIQMHWRFVRVPNLPRGFITGDRSLIRSNGIGRIDGFLFLPTGPRTFFIACVDKRTADAFESQKPKDLERAINDSIVRQSTRFVVATGEEHTRFIHNHMFDGKEVPKDAMGDVTWKSPFEFDPWEYTGPIPIPWA